MDPKGLNLNMVRIIIHQFFLFPPLILAVLLGVLKDQPTIGQDSAKQLFLVMLLLTGVTLLLARVVRHKMLDVDALKKKHRDAAGNPDWLAIGRAIKTGTITLSGIGEASGLMGVAMYVLTRSPMSFVFFGFSALQYVMTLLSFRAAVRRLNVTQE